MCIEGRNEDEANGLSTRFDLGTASMRQRNAQKIICSKVQEFLDQNSNIFAFNKYANFSKHEYKIDTEVKS